MNRPSHADVQFIAASVSVRLGYRQPEREDAITAHRIIVEYPDVRAALESYRSAQDAVNAAINSAIRAELDSGRIRRAG